MILIQKSILSLIWTFSLSILVCNGQQSTRKSLSINVGPNIQFLSSEFRNTLDNTPKIRPSLGVSIVNSKQWVHQLTLREIWFQNNDNRTYVNRDGRNILIAGGHRNSFNFSLRYTYGKIFFSNNRFSCAISIGIVPEYYFNNWTSQITGDDFDSQKINLYSEIIPQLKVKLFNKSSLQLSLPLKINSLNFEKVDNFPNSGLEPTTKSSSNYWFPPVFEFWLSFCYHIK